MLGLLSGTWVMFSAWKLCFSSLHFKTGEIGDDLQKKASFIY